MPLSKSDYILFLKHPAWLWLKKHDRAKLPLVSDELQAVFDIGHDFESYVYKLFPGSLSLGFDPQRSGDYCQLLIRTKQAIENGAKTIFQARFLAGDITCIIDVLDRVADLEELKKSMLSKAFKGEL